MKLHHERISEKRSKSCHQLFWRYVSYGRSKTSVVHLPCYSNWYSSDLQQTYVSVSVPRHTDRDVPSIVWCMHKGNSLLNLNGHTSMWILATLTSCLRKGMARKTMGRCWTVRIQAAQEMGQLRKQQENPEKREPRSQAAQERGQLSRQRETSDRHRYHVNAHRVHQYSHDKFKSSLQSTWSNCFVCSCVLFSDKTKKDDKCTFHCFLFNSKDILVAALQPRYRGCDSP